MLVGCWYVKVYFHFDGVVRYIAWIIYDYNLFCLPLCKNLKGVNLN